MTSTPKLAVHMRQEMAAQPQVVDALMGSLVAPPQEPCRVALGDPALAAALTAAPGLLVNACGSSRHAALLARPAFLRLGGVPVAIEYAHEVPHLGAALSVGAGLAVSISQSGETTETCAGQRHLRALNMPTLALVARPDCTLAREATWHLQTHAGLEQAIPSTKGFVGQASLCLALAVACHDLRRRPWGPQAPQIGLEADALWQHLLDLPHALRATLGALAEPAALGGAIGAVAAQIATARQAICLGLGAGYAAACEGALKLKEAAYVPATSYLLPEFRHGPQAMVEPQDVLVALWPGEQVAGSPPRRVRELAALGAPLCVICPSSVVQEVRGLGGQVRVCPTPDAGPHIWPLVATVVLQALSLAAADARGVDADAPRYLVKSVVGD